MAEIQRTGACSWSVLFLWIGNERSFHNNLSGYGSQEILISVVIVFLQLLNSAYLIAEKLCVGSSISQNGGIIVLTTEGCVRNQMKDYGTIIYATPLFQC
jgi:hypothetical protein